MRVVVTRPEISAAKTAERLRLLGHDPVLLPLSKAMHHPQVATDALALPHSALIVTSAEALRALANTDYSSEIGRNIQLFAVGEKTATAANAAGFGNIHIGAGNGTGLADLIASTLDKPDLPLLYLAGKPRAGSLEGRLEELGLPVRVAEIYEMIPVEYPPEEFYERLRTRPPQAVLLYSRENALRFFEIVERHALSFTETKILCISTRTADAVPAAFRAHLRIAESPDENALLALL
ncbi:uroporphyrinogen-III synthase [Rhizobium sp. ZW T2_16]|uniref:uroporphyrinogen-III synthase n=1 Tax=Rhizobium sp. ZW T2_16 TaxID=3378083 RepID=UPI000FAE4B5F